MDRLGRVVLPHAWKAYALLLALLTWPIVRLSPVGGLDGSWQAGIVMAMDRGLRWGVDIIFTYGPLGFLTIPQLYSPRLGASAWIFVAIVHLGICFVIVELSLHGARWWVGLPLAFVGALVVAPIPPTTAVVVVTLILAVHLLARPTSAAATTAILLVAIGAPLVLLIKLNDGVAMFGILVALLIGRGLGKWIVSLVGACAAASLLGLWLLAGQEVRDIPPFVRLSLEVTSGYSTAMGIDDPQRGGQLLAAGLWALAIVAALMTQTASWHPRPRIAIGLAVSIVFFLAYKEAFVRHGGGGFFEILLVVSVWGFPWRPAQSYYRAVLFGALLTASIGASGATPIRYINIDGPGVAASQAASIMTTSDRVRIIESARADLRDAYKIPPNIIQTIGTRSMHVEPYETAVAWAYPRFNWRPLPMIQTYGAYTEALDQANADALRSPTGPQFILSHGPATIDGRSPFLEAPLSVLEMACRFTEVEASGGWQLLERSTDRCGSERLLGRVSFKPGERIQIPEADDGYLVVVRIDGIETTAFQRAVAFIYKSPTWQIWRDGVGKGRLVPLRTSGPMLLSVPDMLDWSPAFSPPSAQGSFAVVTGPRAGVADATQPDVVLTATFQAIPLD